MSLVFLLTSTLMRKPHYLLGGVLHAVCDRKVQTGVLQNLLAKFYVGAFHANHNGDLDFELTRRGDDAVSQRVAAQDAAKYVDQNRFDAGIGKQNAEGVLDLFRVGPTSHIQ